MVMERVWISLTLLALAKVCYGQQTVCYLCYYATTECLKGDCTDIAGGEYGDEGCQDMSVENIDTDNCTDGCMKADVSYKYTITLDDREIRNTYFARGCAESQVNDGCESYEKYFDRTSPNWRDGDDEGKVSDLNGDICKCTEDKCNGGSMLAITASIMFAMALIAIYGK